MPSELDDFLYRIAEAVSKLSPEHRKAILDRYAQDNSHKGIMLRTLMSWAANTSRLDRPHLRLVNRKPGDDSYPAFLPSDCSFVSSA